ncbi:MAG: hypothetical protein K8R36_12105, partial [Planctomycetales bacterium]|nr:hypothetical protein [Planctomycetales bacterium]
RTILGGFDTPGDEGIPGMWEKELEQRNREMGKGVGNAECGLRSEEQAELKAERQFGVSSLAPVLRGEGRGEGPELRVDPATSKEYAEITQDAGANMPPKTENTAEILSDRNENKATEVLSRKSPESAQVPQQQAITNSTPAEKVLSNNPPKVPRYRLMGTAAEMAVSKNYDEFFSPEERAYRALEKAKAEQRKRMESRAPHQPLTPTLSPEYRGEGAGLRAPQPAYAPSPQLPIARPPR